MPLWPNPWISAGLTQEDAVSDGDAAARLRDTMTPRSHAPYPATADRHLRAVDDALLRRRRAIGDLGDALRHLVESAVTTEAATEELVRAAERIRRAAAPLGERARDRTAV